MSDLQRYIEKRRIRDTEFAEGFEEGYAIFKLGVLLRQAREAAGLTQEEIAHRIGIPTSTISRIENDTENVRLSLLRQYAEALGRNLHVGLA
jgi:DNA-binding XRE family transcriptional regulator